MEDLKAKYNPEGSVLRRAQLRMTEMLVWFDGICRQYGLEYWLDSGTLLGAVRHGGFIPWDDDTDVCMTREAYKKLKKILAKDPHSDRFILTDHDSDRNYFAPWGTIRDLGSEYVRDTIEHKIKRHRGLQIDVFIMEDVHIQIFKRLCVALTIRMFRIISSNHLFMARVIRFFEMNLLVPVMRFITRMSPKPVLGFEYPLFFSKTHSESAVFPTKDIEFEGHTMRGPADDDTYLRDYYGDYMIIPPEEKRLTHNVEILFYD